MIIILGLGNPLLKDDGIGPRVIRELQKNYLPSGVKAIEAGGSFYNYWDLLMEPRHVIVVDSMLGGGPPGTIYLLDPEQIGEKAEWGLRHEVHFLDVLKMAAFYGAKPKVTIIGVEPKEITYSLELSPEISAKLPEIIKVISTFVPMAIFYKKSLTAG